MNKFLEEILNNSYIKNEDEFNDWIESSFINGEDNNNVYDCRITSIEIIDKKDIIRKGYRVNDPKHPERKKLGGTPSYKLTIMVNGIITYKDGTEKELKNERIVKYLKMKDHGGKTLFFENNNKVSISKENELEKRAKYHKKHNKGLGFFKGAYLNPDAGDVEKGIEIFNNKLPSIQANSSEISSADSSVGVVTSVSESVGKGLSREELINEIRKYRPGYRLEKQTDQQLFRTLNRIVDEERLKTSEKTFKNDIVNMKQCEICGAGLNELGQCPVCDQGENRIDEDSDPIIQKIVSDVNAQNPYFGEEHYSAMYQDETGKYHTELFKNLHDLRQYLKTAELVDGNYYINNNKLLIQFFPKIGKGRKVKINALLNNGYLEEANYGGAYDIDPEQFFTRDDLDDLSYEVVDIINSSLEYPFEYLSSYVEDDGTISVAVLDLTNDMEFESNQKIDMRKIKKPNDLITKYKEVFAKDIIDQANKFYAEFSLDQ